MSKVVFQDVTKTYFKESMEKGKTDRITAVDGFSLEIRDHEFITLTGPSECGKTTVLRLVMGLEEPDSGEILTDSKWITHRKTETRNTGMVFQSGSLYPHMTVYKNLAFPLKKQKLQREEADARIRETAALLKITEILSEKPGKLTKEENQRAAIARAIVSMPDVVVMDEPLRGLDEQERGRLRAELIRLRERRLFTVIYAAYDLAEAMALGDRAVQMEEGRILSVNTPEELLRSMRS